MIAEERPGTDPKAGEYPPSDVDAATNPQVLMQLLDQIRDLLAATLSMGPVDVSQALSIPSSLVPTLIPWSSVLRSRPSDVATGSLMLRAGSSPITAVSECAPGAQTPSLTVDDAVFNLMRRAKDERFEDGMESAFSRGIESLVWRCGDRAMDVLAHAITYEKVGPEIASEALRWLGLLRHAPTYRYRRWLLEQSLQCSSVHVRDGALLGLSFMADPASAESIRRAYQRETWGGLREQMGEVLRVLGSKA